MLATLQTEWLWFDELGQDQVFWTILQSRWVAAGLTGLATTAFMLGNFWVVERAAPPGTARFRAILLRRVPGDLARRGRVRRQQGRGGGLAAGRALAPPERLRHRRPAVPQGRGVLRLLAAALPADRPLAPPHGRGHARLLVRRARGNRGAPHDAGPGVRHAHGPGSPAGARRPAPSRSRLAALAQPVRPRASARRGQARGRVVHGRARPPALDPGARGGLRRLGGHPPVLSRAAIVVAPGDRAGVGGGGRARQPVVRAVGGPALLRRSPDAVEGASLPRALGQVHPARLRARPRGRTPGADGRHDLPSGAQGQPGRAQEHPALGQRRPPAADRPATARSARTTTSRTSRSTATATTESHGRCSSPSGSST